MPVSTRAAFTELFDIFPVELQAFLISSVFEAVLHGYGRVIGEHNPLDVAIRLAKNWISHTLIRDLL